MMILREEKFETAPAIYVEKRDGRRVAFDVSKIYKAMVRAAQEVGPLNPMLEAKLEAITDRIVAEISSRFAKYVKIYEIQNIVEHELLNAKEYAIAENYITYRTQRDFERSKATDINFTIDKLLNKDRTVVNENANKDSDVFNTQRDLTAGIVGKSIGLKMLPPHVANAHQNGNPLVPIDESVEPAFEDGSKEKTILGQGTYTIAPDGAVTFTPNKQFVGKPDPVTVKRVDKNGTPVTATYSPEFTKVTPTGTGTKTEGLQGQVQEGQVTFTSGHNSVSFPAGSTPLFDNNSTVKEVPNVGKFEVDADGKVTFTPDKQFKGETPELELTRTDVNGTPVTVKYQAVVKEVTPTSTNATSTGPQGVPQTGTPTFAGGDL